VGNDTGLRIPEKAAATGHGRRDTDAAMATFGLKTAAADV
jgi:hypothetical protein